MKKTKSNSPSPKITKTIKAIAQKYVRILTRGKKNAKIVPILLNEQMKECIDMLLSFRKEAGIVESNPYIFALLGILERQFIEAAPLLTRYAEQCDAKIPKLLRGTRLRKHVATVGLALNLTDGQVSDLS